MTGYCYNEIVNQRFDAGMKCHTLKLYQYTFIVEKLCLLLIYMVHTL